MFDIMDMEDDQRNNLLQLTDSQMKVCSHANKN